MCGFGEDLLNRSRTVQRSGRAWDRGGTKWALLGRVPSVQLWVADDADNWSWAGQQGGTRNKGCDDFVEQQDKMAVQIVGNGGYYLDLSGNLQRLSDGSLPARFSGQHPMSLLRL